MTRYLLIALALGLAAYRARQRAWLPAAGLLAMAIGLIVLKLAERRPGIRPVAYVCFAGTAVTIAVILVHGYR
jgi:hypothetical protein